MTMRKVLIAWLVVALACIYVVAQQPKVKEVPVKNISPAAGQQMYVTYCATCHGMDGKGTGPAAAALKIAPPDLTQLAKKNNGQFPSQEVQRTILGDAMMPAHGSKDMPVWGGLFSAMCSGSTKNEASMRVYNITEYVKTLQQ